MRTNLIGTVALALIPVAAAIAVPNEQTVSFQFYDTPTDPNSDVVFAVELTLVPDMIIESEFGPNGWVGWELTNAKFIEPDAGGDIEWNEAYPYVDTADGLWWVAHADMGNILIAEFVEPPLVSGTADPVDVNEDDLDYNFEGGIYTPPASPREPPHPVTGALTYSFQRAAEPPPIEDGNDEPVEIPEGPHDP